MEMLVVVKAYPVIDQKSKNEAVCIAGVSTEGPIRWIRLFPVDFRGLQEVQKFSKYSVVRFEAKKATGDPRPETFTPDLSSISIVRTLDARGGSWSSRMDYLNPLEVESMCALIRRQRSDRASLGIFRPAEVLELQVRDQEASFADSQLALLSQPSLTGDRVGDLNRTPLEPMPVKAKYRYRCSEAGCKTHTQTVIDWEMGSLYRNLERQGESSDQIHLKIRQKYLNQLCGPDRDTRFIAGTMLRHPASFLVLGVVAPVLSKQPQSESLF